MQDGLRAQCQHLPGAADGARHRLLQRARLARGGLATGEEGSEEGRKGSRERKGGLSFPAYAHQLDGDKVMLSDKMNCTVGFENC